MSFPRDMLNAGLLPVQGAATNPLRGHGLDPSLVNAAEPLPGQPAWMGLIRFQVALGDFERRSSQ